MNDRASLSRRAPRGFSLIELLVVMAIIAVMAAVALPAILRSMRLYRIRGAAQDVAGEIARARGRAITTNANRGVLFVPGVPDPSDGTNQPSLTLYQVWPEQDPSNPGQFPPLPIGGACPCPPGARTLPPNGVVRQLPTGIFFVPGGTPGGNWGGHAVRFDRLGKAYNPGDGCTDAAGPPPNGPLVVRNAATGNLVVTVEERRPLDAPGTGVHRMTIQVEPGGKIVTRDWVQP